MSDEVTRLSADEDVFFGGRAIERLESEEERDLTLPPYSLQAEEAVLGSVLKNPHCIVQVMDWLKGRTGESAAQRGDFYSQRCGYVFQAMLELHRDGTPIDYHTVSDRLTQLGTYERAGGLLYLSDLSLSTPTAAFVEHYGRIIERTSLLRQLIGAAQKIAEDAYRDDKPLDKALNGARDKILAVTDRGRPSQGFKSLSDILSDYMEQVESIQEGESSRYGIPTGYMDLDKLLGGMQRTDLIILAARTSVGKTAFAINLAINAAVKSNATVAMFSLEMSMQQLAPRLLSMESGIEGARIRSAHLNEQESRKLDSAMNHLANAPIFVDDSPRLSLDELLARTRRFAAERTLDLVIVDYIQLLPTENRNRATELGVVSGALKELARELNVPLIALCQLNRKVDDRQGHVPQLSDLRESGNLEQDADVVMFLVREEKYDPDTDKKGVADIIVAKHRNGPTGQVQLLFLERSGKFLDLEVFRA